MLMMMIMEREDKRGEITESLGNWRYHVIARELALISIR
jgi:hypothetical protein